MEMKSFISGKIIANISEVKTHIKKFQRLKETKLKILKLYKW